MFVPVKPFHPSLMLARKARMYPSKAPFQGSTLGYDYSQTLDLTRKAYQ
jgi:hypothetical protein